VPEDDVVEADPACRVWWDEARGIAHNDWRPQSVCTLQQARAVTQATKDLGFGAVPVLVDMRFLSKADRAARVHFTSSEGEAKAVALLVSSPVSKVVANVMVGLLRSAPTRTFTDEALAVKWLMTHR